MSTLVTTALDEAVCELVPLVGKKAACAAVGLPRASYYRANPVLSQPAEPAHSSAAEPVSEPAPPLQRPRQNQPRALSAAERAAVLEVLHSERFADAAPATIYATLLDEGTYLLLGRLGGGFSGGIDRMRTWLTDAGLLLVGEPYWIKAEPDEIHELSGFIEPGSV